MEYNVTDSRKRKLVHYAAACIGTGPLEVLISKNFNFMEID